MSFYSSSLYRDVCRNWKGWGLAYLFFLLALYWIPETVKMQLGFSKFLDAEAPKFVRQIPTITISKGEVSIDKPVPYLIKYPGKEYPFAIIDTSGRYKSLDSTEALVLLTKTELIIRQEDSGARSIDLSPVNSFVADRQRVNGWLDTMRKWFAVMIYPFALFFSFLYYVAQVLACAMLGTLYAKRFGLDLSYETLARLSAVSFTPVVILQSVHSLLDIEFPYVSFISFLIASGYLYYAVGVNSEK